MKEHEEFNRKIELNHFEMSVDALHCEKEDVEITFAPYGVKN